MPGAYAHISIVNETQKRTAAAGLRRQTSFILSRNLKYLELGAVSPDYPYLAFGEAKWADNMHYSNTSILLRAGVEAVGSLPEGKRARATAWLCGFAAHMAADMTIHPVVEIKVGPYKDNKSEHRRCEMHQDAYIFPKIVNVGDTGLSRHLSTGIAACNAEHDTDQLEETVTHTWNAMLGAAYPNDVADESPNPSKWHNGFRRTLLTMASANRLFPLSRHVGVGLNIAYPQRSDVLDTYIKQLSTPEGFMDYDELFERACRNVLEVWKGIDLALADGSSKFLDEVDNWDLDTGRCLSKNEYVFWKN